jgi:hypothetical protein
MVFHVPVMIVVRVVKVVVRKVDDEVSDPNDPEYQARKRGEKQDGKLRKVLANCLKKGAQKLSGEGRPEHEQEEPVRPEQHDSFGSSGTLVAAR